MRVCLITGMIAVGTALSHPRRLRTSRPTKSHARFMRNSLGDVKKDYT